MTMHAALIHFLDFRIQEGDLQSRTRVFTITIGQAPTCYPMDIAATVVLSRSNSMKIYPNLFLCLSVLSFLHGCMYLQSPPSSHRSGHRLQQLHTLKNLYTKKHDIVAIDVLKKTDKQHRLLTEVIVPDSVTSNLLTDDDIFNDIVVVDGGDLGNPSIRPPDGVTWRPISVMKGEHIYTQDDVNPLRGLSFKPVDGVRPFIRLPRKMSLNILRQNGMEKIFSALEECSKMKRTSLVRSDRKRIFGDYGERVMATCAGVQVSRNSQGVLDCAPFMEMENFPQHHWRVLMRLMRCAEYCFEAIADHQVISHVYHAKQVVPFKTMNMSSCKKSSTLKYYGGLSFGCNLFLCCHIDDDFTMSMAHVHLKGKDQYSLADNVVVYFCFPTLGVAVPLRPGDFLLFNAQIPHCVSSRCKHTDQIMVLSMYLKTSVVGLNNNDLQLNTRQAILAQRYHSNVSNQLQSSDRQTQLSSRYRKFYESL